MGEPGELWIPEDLEAYARIHERVNEDGYARDFTWTLDPAFPISRLKAPDDWIAWFDEEAACAADDGRPGTYDEILERSIEEPIVLHLDDEAMGRIWDGFHRTGGSVKAGRSTVPAVVGTRRRRAAEAAPANP